MMQMVMPQATKGMSRLSESRLLRTSLRLTCLRREGRKGSQGQGENRDGNTRPA